MVNNRHIPEFKRGCAWAAHQAGRTHQEIQDMYKMSACTSARIVRDYKLSGKTKASTSTGRKPKHTPEVRRRILGEIDGNRTDGYEPFMEAFNCSKATIQRIAEAGGFFRQVRSVVCPINAKCKAKRLSWTRQRLPGCPLATADVLFSDEVPLQVGRHGQREFCFRKEGEALREDLVVEKARPGPVLMVWACIGVSLMSLMSHHTFHHIKHHCNDR
jgi:transposase